ncbi:MAG: hypothetical protein AMXMBFR53_13580 [Gemmatimonadota bacterium]
MPEAWLRGPVPGVPVPLQPVAHSLLDAVADVRGAAGALPVEAVWQRPGGAPSVGFHLRHARGSLERLLAYARGETLTEAQLAAIPLEKEPGDPPADAEALLADLEVAVEAALDQLRATPEASLPDERRVGRAGLPSTVLGLLFHAAEHTRRHAGQVVATATVARGLPAPSDPAAVRDVCLRAALDAWEDAGLRGLCAEGRWEAAVGAIRSLEP